MVKTNSGVTIVSLQDAKDIARTISNKTSQSIIEYIKTNKGATATKIAKDLDLPASTVHYNISALVKAKILSDETFHYSSKGKEVIHYEVSDQVIVIVPETMASQNRLKTILPGILGAVVVAGIWLGSKFFSSLSRVGYAAPRMALEADMVTVSNQAEPVLMAGVSETAKIASNVVVKEPNILLVFLLGLSIGIAFVLLVWLITYLVKKNKSKKTIKK